ncbi:MAG: M28 family peptidase [Planctomycetes bacterium]|nr:M28 family peptidase [Planctomycetota bacterium]
MRILCICRPLLAFLPVAIPAPSEGDDVAPAEARIAAEVSAERMSKEVAALVAIGPRMGGTPSGDRAAAHLADAFRAAGVDSVEVVTDEAAKRLVHEEEWFSVRLGDSPPRELTSAWPYGYSPSLAPSAVDVVEAKGDLSGFDWTTATGKAVLVHSSPRRLICSASGAHVVAILTDFTGDFRLDPDAAFIQELPPSKTNPVPVFAISKNDAAAISAAVAAGAARVGVGLGSSVHEGTPKTVIATIRGKDHSRRLVLCAHGDSDSGGPGADDNASGESVVLEVARVLAQAKRSGGLPQLETDVEFVIWGSEIHSTNAYLERMKSDSTRRVVGVLSWDQAGTGAERDCLYVEPDDVPVNAVLVNALASIGERFAGKDGEWKEFTTNRSLGGADSYVFTDAPEAARVPAVTIFTAAFGQPTTTVPTPGRAHPAWNGGESIVVDYSRFYHSSRDVAANTTDREPWNMVWCARMGARAVIRLVGPKGALLQPADATSRKK